MCQSTSQAPNNSWNSFQRTSPLLAGTTIALEATLHTLTSTATSLPQSTSHTAPWLSVWASLPRSSSSSSSPLLFTSGAARRNSSSCWVVWPHRELRPLPTTTTAWRTLAWAGTQPSTSGQLRSTCPQRASCLLQCTAGLMRWVQGWPPGGRKLENSPPRLHSPSEETTAGVSF